MSTNALVLKAHLINLEKQQKYVFGLSAMVSKIWSTYVQFLMFTTLMACLVFNVCHLFTFIEWVALKFNWYATSWGMCDMDQVNNVNLVRAFSHLTQCIFLLKE